MAGGSIGTLAVNVVANTQKLQKGIKSARMSIGNFRKAATVGFAALGAAGTAAAFAITKAWREVAPEIDKAAKTADKLGVAVETLQELRHAAKLSGIAVTTFDMAMQRMTRRVSEAAMGTGEAQAAIKELGLDATSLAKLPLDQQLAMVADRMAEVQQQGDRVRLAFQLFDSEGVSMVNMLQNGGAALRGMQKDANALGITFSRVQAKMVENANDAVTNMQGAFQGLKQELVIGLAPAVKQVADSIKEWTLQMKGGESNADTFASKVSKAFGVIADVLHTVRIGFAFARAGVTKTIAFIAKTISQQIEFIIKQVNKLPGVDVQGGFTESFADEFAKSADEQFDIARKLLEATTPSEKLAENFAKMREDAEAAAKALEKPAEVLPDKLKTFLQGLGEKIGKGMDLGGMAAKAAVTSTKIGSAMNQGVPLAALERGTAEAFSAARAGGQREDIPKKQLNVQEQIRDGVGAFVELFKNVPVVSKTGAT